MLCLIVAGFGPARGDMSRQAPEQAKQAQPGDQQGAEAAGRSRKPFQVSKASLRKLLNGFL